MTSTFDIAVLPGDGIGPEIMPQALAVLQAAARRAGFALRCQSFPWGAEHFLRHGEFMPADGLATLRDYDAILFSAAGHPEVSDERSSWEFVFQIRKQFRQYANLRPVRSYPGVPTPLRGNPAFDMLIVRENSEGEYAGPGGVLHRDWENGVAIQTTVLTRAGVERIARYAFELARGRQRRVTNVTKSNAILHTMRFWDAVVADVARDYPDVATDLLLVDAATMKFVQAPGNFDVIVTTNMYGDILSDLGGALAGSVGLSSSANLDPMGEFPSMYEPVHGSAPDIAGQGIANPCGLVLSAALMLRDLGLGEAAGSIEAAVAAALADGVHTRDLGGRASTVEMGAAVLGRVEG
ncbi:MAG: isocitrate/isopropylmalate dehydrogenase family protein [Anaerolineaceae bacterium]|nr:isocitrate/isopropylmalate dehydrogenase family protein [Anaerolineaceae bacterium]MDE0328093.1 isocitrate/isopropylmalate dehydrogenase family protein [Anaerolineaceae bacterium]